MSIVFPWMATGTRDVTVKRPAITDPVAQTLLAKPAIDNAGILGGLGGALGGAFNTLTNAATQYGTDWLNNQMGSLVNGGGGSPTAQSVAPTTPRAWVVPAMLIGAAVIVAVFVFGFAK